PAAGAIVRLVLGIDDALDRRAAFRTGLAVAAGDGHFRAEGSHLFRESITHVSPQPLRRFHERHPCCLEETGDYLAVDLVGQREPRQPGRVQDLVGVGVADTAEETRVGERPFGRASGVTLFWAGCSRRPTLSERANTYP